MSLVLATLTSRRYVLILLGLGLALSILLLHTAYRRTGSVGGLLSPSNWGTGHVSAPQDVHSHLSSSVRARVERLTDNCRGVNDFEEEYGRINLRMSRGYEGSHYRMKLFIEKALRGERLVIAAIGGSITKGHHVWDNEVWVWKFYEWFKTFIGDDVDVVHVNGAAPAVGSDYFSFCFPLHIPADTDLVLIELGVNDEPIPEHIENMENLIRGLMAMEKAPAVVLVEAMAFSNGGMGGGGGRFHLPVAQFYDIPVINQRHPLVNHFARYPELVPLYFASDFWGNPDTRHVNSRGHRDLGMLVGAFVRDVACDMLLDPLYTLPSTYQAHPAPDHLPPHATSPLGPAVADLPDGVSPPPPPTEAELALLREAAAEEDTLMSGIQSLWPAQARSWRFPPDADHPVQGLLPGFFNSPPELPILPRQKVLDGWNPSLDNVVPPFHPVCLSTRTTDPAFDLVPLEADGWEHWVHPDFQDKPYLVAKRPGAWAKFELATGLGVIKVYSLRSRSFGLGNVGCWIGDDRSGMVTIEGYWDNDANIGRFTTVKEGLPVGKHTLTCELLSSTADPEGGTEFRMIGVMSL